jgi:hypothetical protein
MQIVHAQHEGKVARRFRFESPDDFLRIYLTMPDIADDLIESNILFAVF